MDKIHLFKDVFKGRTDVVPRFWQTKDGQRSGYSPLCRNEWKQGICKKPCRTCDNADYIPLSDEQIWEHLTGIHILGVYPLLPDSTCTFIAADFDNHNNYRNPLSDVKRLYETCQVQNIPCYLLRSKSGKGYHTYLFFYSPVPAWKARVVMFALLKEAECIGEDDALSSFDRLFPNQDKPTGIGLGNLIALPFQGKAAKFGHTLFLDPNKGFKKPYKNQFEILRRIEKISELTLDELIEEWDLCQKRYKHTLNDFPKEHSQAVNKLLKCQFIRWCREHPDAVPEPLWYALISNLVSVRPGGYSLCHEFSREHAQYTREETDYKIHQALDATAPHTCEYIKNNGFSCDEKCGVKAPVALMYR